MRYVSTGSSDGGMDAAALPSPCPGYVCVSPCTAHTPPAETVSAVSNFSPA